MPGRPRRLRVVATEVKGPAVKTKDAAEEIETEDRRAATGRRRLGRRRRPHLAGIEAIRPVFENINEPSTTEPYHRPDFEQRGSSPPVHRRGRRQRRRDRQCDQGSGGSWRRRRERRQGRHDLRANVKSRCAVLLSQGERNDRRKNERLPCNLKIELSTSSGAVTAPVYQISMEGILIRGPDVGRLPEREIVEATLEAVGSCRIRIVEHLKAGTRALF